MWCRKNLEVLAKIGLGGKTSKEKDGEQHKEFHLKEPSTY